MLHLPRLRLHFTPAWKKATQIFLLSRVLFLVLTYLTYSRFPVVISNQGGQHPLYRAPHECLTDLHNCLNAWRHWDTGNYATIAFKGYVVPKLTAFFPLWPLIMRSGSSIFGQFTPNTVYYAGLLLSNLFFFLALVLLYHLLSHDFEASIAHKALMYLALSPYALFFFAPYTESLFLFWTAALFYYLQRGQTYDWWLAGCCGFGAALTRSTGIILIFPFLALLIQRYWPLRQNILKNWKTLLNAFLPSLLIPLGITCYMLYLWKTQHNPLEFSIQEAQWNRKLALPWTGILVAIQALFLTAAQYRLNLNIIEIFFTVLPLIILVAGWKRLPLHYNFLVISIMIFSLMHPIHDTIQPLASAPRYVFTLFPTFVILALWEKKPHIHQWIIIISLLFLITNTILFMMANWVA